MRVVHCKVDPFTHYIGRLRGLGDNPLANPFRIGTYASRDQVITRYEEWARSRPDVLARIAALPENAVLGCWCAPRPCHGDVIVKLWKEQHGARL